MAVTCSTNLKDIQNPVFWRDVAMEVFVSALLLFFLTANMVSYGDFKVHLTHAGLVMGFGVFIIIEGFGHISGAHMNPAVTFMFAIKKEISIVRAIFYIIAQCIGAVCGAYLLYGLTAPSHRDMFWPFKPAEGMHVLQGLGVEIILTIILCSTILGVSNTDQRTMVVNTPGLPIGLAVALDIMIGGTYTGAAMNPLIALGPAVITGTFKHYWIYWAGPFLGAAISVLIDSMCSYIKRRFDNNTEDREHHIKRKFKDGKLDEMAQLLGELMEDRRNQNGDIDKLSSV